MAEFITQAEEYLANLEQQIAKLEEESAQKDAEIRRLTMRVSNTPADLKRELTYVMIKPDGVQRGLVGEICARFESKGFKLVGMKMLQAPRKMLEQHYADLKGKPFFPGLVEYMQLGPVVAMVWEGDNVVKSARTMLGATKIRQSANDLVSTLRRCETHYVRCIKSNDDKAPMTMDNPRVQQQVQYQGLRENVKVKKAGYSYRAPYSQFLQNFSMLASRHEQGQLAGGMAGAQQLTQFLSRKFPDIVPATEWAFGKTLLFVHSPQTIFALQELMEEARDPKGYAEKVKAAEQAEQAALKQEQKIAKGKVKGKTKKDGGGGGCMIA